MTDRYLRVNPTHDCNSSDTNTTHRRNESIQITSKEGVTDLLSFDSIWSESDAEVPSHLARIRDLLTSLFDSHYVGCIKFRWTETDHCELSIGGTVLPAMLFTELISDQRYNNELVSLMTHYRQAGFQLKFGHSSISTTHCDGSNESDETCIGDCPEGSTAYFAEPVLDDWNYDPSLSMDPIITVATLILDKDFINPEEVFFSSEHEHANADCEHCDTD